VILDELVLENFGSFAGRQVLHLTPREDHPVVVIAALNGSGKTTVLEALQLALYGPLAPPSARRGASYDAYLSSMIHRGTDREVGARIELGLRAHVGGTERSFVIIRAWWTTKDGRIKEDLRIVVDGQHDPVISSAWAEHVEQMVPRGVAGLFFFDGEQIEALADLDASRDVIETAVSGLLGLELIDRLIIDLDVLERRKRTAAVADESHQQLNALAAVVETARAAEAAVRQELEESIAALARNRRALKKVEDRITREGGAAHDDRANREAAVTAATAELATAEQRLVDANSTLSPLLLVPDLVHAVARQGRLEQTQRENNALARQLSERDELLLAEIANLAAADVVDDRARTALMHWLAVDRKRRSATLTDTVLDCADSVTAEAERLSSDGLAAVRDELADLLADVEAAREAWENAVRSLAQVPSADSLTSILVERDTARDAVAVGVAKVAEREESLGRAQVHRERTEARRQAMLTEASHGLLQAEDAARLLTHAARAQTTLRRLRETATARHAERIQSCILEATQALLHKSDLIADVRIDPATHALTLFGPAGEQVRPNGLSAGERQLLAISLLWGLARSAGRPLPVVIDTPLGRLDGTHRHRLLDRYFPAASHQVIVLSTDTEVDRSALHRLEGSLSHVLHLNHDHDRRATQVRAGYLHAAEGSVA